MYYYQKNDAVLCTREPVAELSEITEQQAAQAQQLLYYSRRTGAGKRIWCINHAGYLADAAEGLWCLDRKQLTGLENSTADIPQWLHKRAEEGSLTGISNLNCLDAALQKNNSSKKRVHIVAMGDVGGTLLIGLSLLGGDCIGKIGIFDFNENLCRRWEHEINQIAYPWQYDRLPEVEVVTKEQLFDCDVFVFCASKSIPPVGGDVKDVRMAQLEANSAIIAQYGQMARDAEFRGLFAVVSDPVDPLCRKAWDSSNRNEEGVYDGRGLRPEQVQGYGLGVMNSRAAYYAKQDERFARFLTEGRAYGPHGQKLVIADSIEHYNHERSMELTKKTVEANLEVRALGYKPYVAPALSSAAISILLTLRGEWHYSSNFLGGIYMGARNRYTPYGLEMEHLPLPEQLLGRLQDVVDELSAIV